MAKTALANTGIQYEHTLGSGDWKNSYDANWIIVDALMQAGVISTTILAEPGSPSVGDAYILPSGTKTGTNWGSDAGAVTNAVAIYMNVPDLADSSPWFYITPKEGWKMYDRVNNITLLYNGSSWAQDGSSGGGWTHELKDSGNQSISSQTTFQAITDLSFAVAANEDYKFDAWIQLGIAASAMGYKISCSGPSGTTLVAQALGRDGSNLVHSDFFSLSSELEVDTSDTSNKVVHVSGIVNVGGTAGTFGMEYAQRTSNGSNLTAFGGSVLSWQQIS